MSIANIHCFKIKALFLSICHNFALIYIKYCDKIYTDFTLKLNDKFVIILTYFTLCLHHPPSYKLYTTNKPQFFAVYLLCNRNLKLKYKNKMNCVDFK